MPETPPASDASDTPSAAPFLPDPWATSGRVRLDGAFESGGRRSARFQFVTACVALAGGFVAFQVGSAVVLALQLAAAGTTLTDVLALPFDELLATYTRELITGNSLGQVLGLLPVALLFAFQHSRDVTGYLRLRRVDALTLGLAVAGIVAGQPVVQWLARVNQWILPDALAGFDADQLRLIEAVLAGEFTWVFLVGTLALVPGLCEELLFRGYVQRQFERAAGPLLAVGFSGLVFGLYHLRPTHVLPLVAIGVYLAYLTWRTGSVVPSIVAHVVHNGIAVTATRFAEDDGGMLETVRDVAPPWYAVVAGFVFFGAVVYVLDRFASSRQPPPA